VLCYLSRYTHRVAISNRRLIAADQNGVTFRYKDYRIEPGRYKTMTFDTNEFIRRFLMHVLPKGLHRIRHYGLLANASRAANIAKARELLAAPPLSNEPKTAKAADTEQPRVLPVLAPATAVVCSSSKSSPPAASLNTDRAQPRRWSGSTHHDDAHTTRSTQYRVPVPPPPGLPRRRSPQWCKSAPIMHR